MLCRKNANPCDLNHPNTFLGRVGFGGPGPLTIFKLSLCLILVCSTPFSQASSHDLDSFEDDDGRVHYEGINDRDVAGIVEVIRNSRDPADSLFSQRDLVDNIASEVEEDIASDVEHQAQAIEDDISRHRLTSYEDHSEDDDEDDDDDDFAVEVTGGNTVADKVASELGMTNLGQIRGFHTLYRFRKNKGASAGSDADDSVSTPRSKRNIAEHHRRSLAERSEVKWAEHQRTKRRMKRDVQLNEREMLAVFNDPYWPKQWPLHDTRKSVTEMKMDLHVLGAWNKGYTGKGVSVTILDDGVQKDHPDLKANFDQEASYDLNDNDTDPTPRFNEYNKHGTRCAGEVAMVANNGICGVGIAYNSKIGGIRILDGKITDSLEAEALQFNVEHVDIYSASWGPNDDGKTVEGPGRLAARAIENGITKITDSLEAEALQFNVEHVDIYSASWGPNDDGKTVEGPGRLAARAIENGITKGRGGKGSIYVWASGNGGNFKDNCDCDGYTDSIYTLSVSSASQAGEFPWYGEQCASTLATTLSSGAYMDSKIVTTDIRGECTDQFSGTSASAPFAAGIVALGLEANPKLNWRDVQHITIWTSEPAPLMNNTGWAENGVGLHVNERFGFGLMNAEAFVTFAEAWKTVPDQRICKTIFPQFKPKAFSKGSPAKVRFKTDACTGQHNFIKFLEHVQIVVDIEYTTRGNLEIFLVSPKGTKAQMLTRRQRDESALGFRSWPFMSVHSWGEDPAGWWELHIVDDVSQDGADKGSVNNITLILYGTTEQPEHYKKGRNYNMDYNRIRNRNIDKEPKV